MNWPLVFCMLAALFYAGEVAAVDRWLTHVSPVAMTMIFGIAIAIFALPGVLHGMQSKTITLPGWKEVIMICAVAFISFLADWTHFAALSHKAGGTTVATFYVFIPIFCSIMKWEMPSLRIFASWVLGGIALYLISDELLE